MKKHLFALLLFIGFVTPTISSSAQSLVIIQPNESYKAPPNDEMIVMDKYTFGNYHYTASQYDTLKQEVKHLDSLLTQEDSSQTQLTRNYERLVFLKQSEINSYQDNYKRLQASTNDCIKHENKLQIDYRKIEQKNRRLKTWRNWFMGTTALLTTIIVMSVVK